MTDGPSPSFENAEYTQPFATQFSPDTRLRNKNAVRENKERMMAISTCFSTFATNSYPQKYRVTVYGRYFLEIGGAVLCVTMIVSEPGLDVQLSYFENCGENDEMNVFLQKMPHTHQMKQCICQ